MRRNFFTLLCCLALIHGASAHPSDVSLMRVKLAHDHIDVRLTLNVINLSRIVVVDTDHNQQITPAEIAKAVPVVTGFLRKHVLVSINDEDADIGTFTKHELMWPNPEAEPVSDRDASQRYVDFNFTKPWPTGVHEVWFGFQVFEQLGPLHTVQATYQQPGEHDEDVVFTQQEPDYLFDTGWTDADLPKPSPAVPAIAASPAKSWLLEMLMAGGVLLAAGSVLMMKARRPSTKASLESDQS